MCTWSQPRRIEVSGSVEGLLEKSSETDENLSEMSREYGLAICNRIRTMGRHQADIPCLIPTSDPCTFSESESDDDTTYAWAAQPSAHSCLRFSGLPRPPRIVFIKRRLTRTKTSFICRDVLLICVASAYVEETFRHRLPKSM